MAYLSQSDLAPALRGGIDRFLSAMRQAISCFSDSLARRDEYEYLAGLSDGELARRGLSRDQIARHVFRDQLAP